MQIRLVYISKVRDSDPLSELTATISLGGFHSPEIVLLRQALSSGDESSEIVFHEHL